MLGLEADDGEVVEEERAEEPADGVLTTVAKDAGERGARRVEGTETLEEGEGLIGKRGFRGDFPVKEDDVVTADFGLVVYSF